MVGKEITLGTRKLMLELPAARKIEILSERVIKEHPKQDSFIAIDGKTGSGKTNTSLVLAGYAAQLTGRKIHLFFTSASTLRFAQRTEKQLIILDEPSLDLLARDWQANNARDFLRLLNTMRRKRHFFIVNLANFWHFPEHLVVDRLNGLIHMDHNPQSLGRCVWIRQNKIESLWNDYKKLHKRNFYKYKSFRFYTPYIMEDGTLEQLDIFVEEKPHATYNDYERLKDNSIRDINNPSVKNGKIDKNLKKLLELRKKIGGLDFKKLGITHSLLAQTLGIQRRTLLEWRNCDVNDPKSTISEPPAKENEVFEEISEPNNNNSRQEEEIDDDPEEDKAIIDEKGL